MPTTSGDDFAQACRTISTRVAGVLLSHARIRRRVRGSRAGHLFACVAVLREVRGPFLSAIVALQDCDEHVPERVADAQTASTSLRAERPGRQSRRSRWPRRNPTSHGCNPPRIACCTAPPTIPPWSCPSAAASVWRLSPPCSICRPCNARFWCCATYWVGRPAKSPRSWKRPQPPSTAPCNAPVHDWPRPARCWTSSANQPNPRCATCSTATWRPSNTPTSTQLAELLRADVELEMPPIPTWFTGWDAVCGFLARVVLHAPDQWRLAHTRANGAPAFAMYRRAPDGSFRAHGLDVLSLIDGRISRIVAFNDPTLVAKFGLPETYDRTEAGEGPDRVRHR